MVAGLMSLVGLFVSGYLDVHKIGRIGTLVCGSGGGETVQLSSWSRFAGMEVSLIGVPGYTGAGGNAGAVPVVLEPQGRR
jgi:Vitamin K epoxide reductase family